MRRRAMDTFHREGARDYRSSKRGARLRARRYRVAAIGLLAGAATLAVALGLRLNDYRLAREEYAGYLAADQTVPAVLSEATGAVPEETAPAVAAMAASLPAATPQPLYSEMLRGYMRQNSDTVAYLDVLDTSVQYPVVQGEDNEYYLTHSFADRHRASGAIFMDAWNSADFSDFNTVIYGHNMKDGSMFHALREYGKPSFLSDHKYIEVTLPHSRRTYKVFAAYAVEDGFDFRGLGCQTQAERTAFLKRVAYRSEISTNAAATAEDSILTLVTCTSGERDRYWVVHAVLVEETAAVG